MSDFVLQLLQGLPEEKLYFTSFYSSKGKKKRLLHKPSAGMKTLHTRMCDVIRSQEFPMKHATGGIVGRSVRDHIVPHLGSRYFYITDIKDAYPSITAGMLTSALIAKLGLEADESDAISVLLTKWFLVADDGGLFMGGPASLDLFNLYCDYWLDLYISRYCLGQEFVYTRYVDDIAISSRFLIADRSRQTVRTYLDDAGFKPNHRKTQVRDIATQDPVFITGVGLRWEDGKARPFISGKKFSEIKGLTNLVRRQTYLTSGKGLGKRLDGKMTYLRDSLSILRETGHLPSRKESELVLKYLGLRD